MTSIRILMWFSRPLAFCWLFAATGAMAVGGDKPAVAVPDVIAGQPAEYPGTNSVVYWYIQSARQGYASSQFQLGKMYAAGDAVAQDYAAAQHWFQLSALQDYPAAQLALGKLYQRGNGVEVDYVTAYAWYHVAAMNRLGAAGIARDYLVQLMDPQQISLGNWQIKKLWKKIAQARQQPAVP